MEHTLIGNYNSLLVLLSFIVILLTSFAAFEVSARLFQAQRPKKVLWLTIGSLTMGGGIWVLHFIGMMAFMHPVPIHYSLHSIWISLGLITAASFIYLLIASKPNVNKLHFIIGSLIMGFSILGMHYIGMSAIHMNVSVSDNPVTFILSVLLAFVPSFIFLKVTYHHRKNETNIPMKTKVVSGILMGLSICAMHYIAMVGTTWTYHAQPDNLSIQIIDSNQLAMIIGICSILILGIVLIGLYLDHTFTKQSTRLKINEQYYKSLFEDNSEAVLLFDLQGRFVHFNQSVNDLYGYSIEELLDQSFDSLVPPERLEWTISQFKLAAHGETTTYETSVLHKNGSIKELHVKNIPILVDGSIVGVFGIIKDITEAKRAEEALIEAESKYRSLVEQSLAGVYIYQDSKIVYANPRLVEIMGYSQEELYELTLADYVYEEDIPLVTGNITKRLVKGIPSLRYEYRAIRKDGNMIYLEIHGTVARYRGQNAVIGTIIDITDRKKSEQTIQHMAYNDYLTGLPNSHFLNKRLNELIDCESETAVLKLELERLNNIRETVGQESGNSLILLASERIKQSLGDHDILVRWQEDKFVILLNDTNHERTKQTAERILEAMSKPLENVPYDVYVNPSIGISVSPQDGSSAETLLEKAKYALDYAKRHGNNSYHFYTADLHGETRENLELEMDLYKAIEQNELAIHYQPQFHLSTGEYIGNEALIRWHHPKWGMISPAKFIPIAEETGLIISIGEWVLRTACTQNKAWQEAGYAPMVISVNLSSRQFLQTNLVDVVERILTETKLEAKYLDLEITESMTMDVKRTIKTLHALKKIGIKISIDDFGTGYSSLNYLKEFPIDRLKIDQSFIRDCHQDPSNATIVKAIISMAHHLNIQVIAEGVETKDHLDFLQQHLCDEVQGYLLSKPLPAEELEGMFSDLQVLIRRFGLTSEISHRLWLERELELTKQELQETIRQQDGMTLKYKYKDGKLIHTMCDGELIYRIGFTPEQIVGKELAEILPLETAERKVEFYWRAWQGEQNVSYEGEANGIYYLATLRPVIRKGKVVEVIASCVDITERKRVEEALRHSENNYRLIAENTSDIITIVDNNGTVLYTSPSSEVVKGYRADELVGLSGFSFVYPDDLQLIEHAFSNILLTKTSQLVQYRYVHKNQNLIYLESRVTPVIGENGEVEHFVVVARDITEQKKAENHLRKWERLSVAGELAAGVAHEIRNPLTSIKGFLQLLDQGAVCEEHYDIILKDFHQVESIINEFLALAKPEAPLFKLTDLQGVLSKVVQLVESEAHLKNIQVQCTLPNEPLLVICDENQLKQVFLNVLINSIESMSQGGELAVAMEKKDECAVIVRIIDQGCGMSEDRVKKLGEPYYSNKEKGTGLGLMSSYKIIHEHQGEIHIESKLGTGTTVEVKLPLFQGVV